MKSLPKEPKFLLMTLLSLIKITTSTERSSSNVIFWPDELRGTQGSMLNLTLLAQHRDTEITLNVDYSSFISFYCEQQQELIALEEGQVIRLLRDINKTIYINASMLGFYHIDISEESHYNDYNELINDNNKGVSVVRVVIGRELGSGQQVFIKVFFTLLFCVALFLMGIDIDWNIVYNTLKRPIGPCIGFAAQFGFMPLAAYFIGSVLLTRDYEKLGFIILGSSPGGSASNFWTAMLKGDVNLSVTMTFLSSVASFGLTSFWVWALGQQYSDSRVHIPYLMILISLLTFTIPLLLGTLFRYLNSQLAHKVKSLLAKPFFLACLIIVPIIGSLTNIYYFYLVSWRHLASGLLLGLCGYSFGAILALLFRQRRDQIIAISLETAIQNGGIAFMVLTLTFPSPYSEIGLLPVISFFFCSTGPVLIIAFALYQAIRCALGDSTACSDYCKELRNNDNDGEDDKDKKEKNETGESAEDLPMLVKNEALVTTKI